MGSWSSPLLQIPHSLPPLRPREGDESTDLQLNTGGLDDSDLRVGMEVRNLLRGHFLVRALRDQVNFPLGPTTVIDLESVEVIPGAASSKICQALFPRGPLAKFIGPPCIGPGQIQFSDVMGVVSLPIDLTMVPQSSGFVSVMAGDSRNFQVWFRDLVGGAPVSNFTDGLEITFQ